MITKLLEQIKDTAVVLPDMRKDIYAAVDHLDVKEPARFPLSPSAALKPARDLYYALVNYYKPGTIAVDPIPAATKLTFKLGHYIESMLVDYFREAYQLKDEQKRVTFGKVTDKDGKVIELSGAIDWAVKIGGETILMDSKSSGSYPFKLLEPKIGSLAPKEDNISQMQLYMHSDWGRKNNVNKAILAYFNKDNSDIKCIEIAYDANLAEELLQRMYSVYEAFKAGQVPPREYVLGIDWQANYSNYRTHDSQDFVVPVEERAVVNVPLSAPKSNKEFLKEFVLTYGNAVVQYSDKSYYVTLGNKGLDLQTLGEKVWETA